VSLLPLVTFLSANNIATVMSLLLTEQKIVVHSATAAAAGDATIALQSLIFPLQWELFFIPVVPVNMLGFLGADRRPRCAERACACRHGGVVRVLASCRCPHAIPRGNADALSAHQSAE
jgi:hypothetical protein